MNWMKLAIFAAVFLAGALAGQFVQARFLAPDPVVNECPDCNCPEIKPCPPQFDLSKLDLKKKGKNTLNITIITVDTTKNRK